MVPAAMLPAISVILPTRDRAVYLREAIDSVLAQHRSDFELIVVDDGSTDATPALLDAVSDSRLRVLRQEPRGISAAMNAGVGAARGQYVARLDSDDRWDADLLATLAAVLDARPDVGVAYARAQAMDPAGHPLPHFLGMPMRFPDDALRSVAFDDCTCNVALLVRRDCLDRAGPYDESLPGNEDWDMWLRVARRCAFAFVDRVLAHVRWHDGNITGLGSSWFAAVLDTRTVPLDKLFAEADLPAESRALRPLAYENVHIFRGTRLMAKGDLCRAIGEFGRAVRVSDAPGRAALRVVWFTFNASRLGRSAAGRRLASCVRGLRHR